MNGRRNPAGADSVDVYELTWDSDIPNEWITGTPEAKESVDECPLCRPQQAASSTRRQMRVCDACERALFSGISTAAPAPRGRLATFLRAAESLEVVSQRTDHRPARLARS